MSSRGARLGTSPRPATSPAGAALRSSTGQLQHRSASNSRRYAGGTQHGFRASMEPLGASFSSAWQDGSSFQPSLGGTAIQLGGGAAGKVTGSDLGTASRQLPAANIAPPGGFACATLADQVSQPVLDVWIHQQQQIQLHHHQQQQEGRVWRGQSPTGGRYDGGAAAAARSRSRSPVTAAGGGLRAGGGHKGLSDYNEQLQHAIATAAAAGAVNIAAHGSPVITDLLRPKDILQWPVQPDNVSPSKAVTGSTGTHDALPPGQQQIPGRYNGDEAVQTPGLLVQSAAGPLELLAAFKNLHRSMDLFGTGSPAYSASSPGGCTAVGFTNSPSAFGAVTPVSAAQRGSDQQYKGLTA
eukprot:gene5576-5814_t